MKRKVPKQHKAAYHLWTSIVGREGSAVLIAVFARTRKEVCDVLRSHLGPPFATQIDESKCHKVTVTDGWGGAQCADVLTSADLIPGGTKRKRGT